MGDSEDIEGMALISRHVVYDESVFPCKTSSSMSKCTIQDESQAVASSSNPIVVNILCSKDRVYLN